MIDRHLQIHDRKFDRSLRQRIPHGDPHDSHDTKPGTEKKLSRISLPPHCVASHTFPNNESTIPSSAHRQFQEQRSLLRALPQKWLLLIIRISKIQQRRPHGNSNVNANTKHGSYIPMQQASRRPIHRTQVQTNFPLSPSRKGGPFIHTELTAFEKENQNQTRTRAGLASPWFAHSF